MDLLQQTPAQDLETAHPERQALPQLWQLAQASAGRLAEALVLDCKARQLVLVAQDSLVVEDLPASLLLVSLLLVSPRLALVDLPAVLLLALHLLLAADTLAGD